MLVHELIEDRELTDVGEPNTVPVRVASHGREMSEEEYIRMCMVFGLDSREVFQQLPKGTPIRRSHMGYGNPPLEEIKTSELVAEIGRRRAMTAEGKCVYCERPLVEHMPGIGNVICRYSGRQREIHDVQ